MDLQITPLNLKASIHIGACSISFLITTADGEIVDYLEKSVSIGHDIFNDGQITRSTIESCVSIISGYGAVLTEVGMSLSHTSVRIVATNIVAEASNKDIFVNRLQIGCDINLEVLDDGEMTRLIYMKTRRRLKDSANMQKQNTLVVHAGPGYTRVILFKEGKIDSYNSYRIGSYRVAASVRKSIDDPIESYKLMNEQIHGQLDAIVEDYGAANVEAAIFIGFEIQRISQYIEHTSEGKYSLESLESFTQDLAKMSLDEIVSKYDLTYHLAEVLLPTLVLNQSLAKALEIEQTYIPKSNYEKGLLQDLSISQLTSAAFQKEVIASAWSLAKKFRVNKKHAKQVTRISLELFDTLTEIHSLDTQSRLLLECAGLLHESGNFISAVAHHKHSKYLVLHSDIFGLSQTDIKIVALITRYHRNSPPKASHSTYCELDNQQQMSVAKLSSLLRIADALDRTHSNRIQEFTAKVSDKRLHLYFKGVNDVSVERIAMKNKGNMFQNIFGLDITLHEDR